MNKHLLPLAFCSVGLLAACTSAGNNQGYTLDRLAPCSGSGSMFASLEIDQWPVAYHATISTVVDAHMETLGGLQTTPLQCTSSGYQALIPPTTALQGLAAKLPPWSTPERQKKLSEADFGPVLLEFARIYECSLYERQYFLAINPLITAGETMDMGDYEKEKQEQQKIITEELRISRPALDRTLLLIGGLDKMKPLAADMECLKRTSLDLRNVLGLAAEASACLPRILDARGSLRDREDPEEQEE